MPRLMKPKPKDEEKKDGEDQEEKTDQDQAEEKTDEDTEPDQAA